MMITAKLSLKKGEVRDDGQANIKIRITRDRVPRYISTKYYVNPLYWDDIRGQVKDGEVLPNGTVRSKEETRRINVDLSIQYGNIQGKIRNEAARIDSLDMQGVMSFLRDKRSTIGLIELLDDKIMQKEKAGVIPLTVKAARQKAEKFGGRHIPMKHVTVDWLRRFEFWQLYEEKVPENKQSTSSLNTVGIRMREIQSAWHIAEKRGIVNPKDCPFDQDPKAGKYVIPSSKAVKRNLTAEDLAKIYTAEIDNPTINYARWMYMLSFFLIGINMKDMFFLKGISGGRIGYKRFKGKKTYNVKIEPEALEIIKKYKGVNWLINAKDHYKDYRTATNLIDKRLKDVAHICGIEVELSTYYARHSWAMIARKSLKMRKEDISLGLGHALKERAIKVTENYLEEEEDQEVIDINNRAVIDEILRASQNIAPPKQSDVVFKRKFRRSRCLPALSEMKQEELSQQLRSSIRELYESRITGEAS